jgi:serine/threonine-protein kinase
MAQRKARDTARLRPRQKFGKFRIVRRIAQGGFADVYRAYDTVEGIHVALKIPHPYMIADRALDDFLKEVRITARLEHPNILHIKNAGFVEDQFVIVYPLGQKTLGDRMTARLSLAQALDFSEQMLEAVAFAHRKRVIHCDIKPDNFILFPGNKLKLSDFGIAKLASRFTMSASGSGTVGYVAPEQAMGRPSLRSDVFSLGLIIYRMISGQRPSWPFEWPLPGHDRLRRRTSPEFVAFLRRSLEVNARKRYATAAQMLSAFKRLRGRVENPTAARRRRRKRRNATNGALDWRRVQIRDFQRQYGKQLEAHFHCSRCKGPMSEAMKCCPWCGHETKTFRHETRFPARCRYCRRGMKLDWRFCPHCYSGLQGPRSDRSYSDRRYEATCSHCRGDLMRFMTYCPWCRAKVKRKWKIEGSKHRCRRCGWGVLRDHWSRCPWCRTAIRR